MNPPSTIFDDDLSIGALVKQEPPTDYQTSSQLGFPLISGASASDHVETVGLNRFIIILYPTL